MKFEFAEYLNPAPIIQEKKKYATFTVREIGGPAELAIWRKEQENKWVAYQANREAFKDKQKQYIAGPDAPQGDGVTWQGSGSVDGFKDITWQDKLSHALSERKRLYKPEIVTDKKAWVYEPISEPKVSFLAKVKAFILRALET